jgi:hypothetical protein
MIAGTDRFNHDALLSAAIELSGHDDFGEPSWEDGFDRLLEGLRDEARLSDLGVEVAATDVTARLTTRLDIIAWRREHPEVADAAIEQPRTGTTILHDLMALDPTLRAPLTWEVDRPVPPPGPENDDPDNDEPDPRIAEVQATLDLADSVIPGFTSFHPMGARLAQECVRMTAAEFRSMIFSVQYRLPSYNRWLLHDADLAPAYRWHRWFLQHLQSRRPRKQWLLKSPAHLWHLDCLAAEYPDVIVVRTHRDPLKVIASISALAAHLRRMATDDVDIHEIAASYVDDIFLGLDRSIDAQRRGVLPTERVVDVQFRAFVADPMATIGRIYTALGRELDAATETRMRAFLAENPGDGGGGGSRYRFADTGLDAAALRERSAEYQAFFDVESEPVV